MMRFLVFAATTALVHAVLQPPIENKIFHKYDASRDQTLDVAEFVPLVYEVSRKPIDTAQEIFKRMDLNHDGTIDTMEAATARKEHGAGVIDSVLAVADVNGDGQLTFEEFKAELNYNKPKSRVQGDQQGDGLPSTATGMVNYLHKKFASLLRRTISSQHRPVLVSELQSQFQLSDSEIAHVVSSLDADKDGFLTVHELERIPGKIADFANIQPPPTV
ncbi:EF hand [Cooperia oncophora]